MSKRWIANGCLCASLAGIAAFARQPEVLKRTVLQKAELPGGRTSMVLVLVELLPGGRVPRHTHPGVEMVYVVEGSLELIQDGHPPRLLNAGDSAMNPAGLPHIVKAGPTGAKVVSTFAVPANEPLTSPAP